MREIDSKEFVRRIKSVMLNPDGRFSFFLGAGCSISSGIPAAGTMVRQWLPRLKQLKTGNDNKVDEWARQSFPEYIEGNESLLYGRVIEDLFLTPDERQQEVQRLIEDCDPGFGYAVLAKLISHEKYGRHCNVVLTTNFDDMVADALYLYTKNKPLVISHDSLAGFVRISRTRPLIIKLHGDVQLAPKNTELETKQLNEELSRVLRNLLTETGLIFMGYGGNDHSIVTALNELPESALQWGIYWVADIIPDNDMGAWLGERNAVWVRHLDFDSLMLNVLDEFRLTGPDPRRFLKLIDIYADTAGCLRFYPDYTDWHCGASDESESKAVDDLTFTNYAEVVVNLTENPLHIITMAERRRIADEQSADLIYKEGLRLYPNSSRLHVSYATFLKETCRGDDQAENHYVSAVQLDQNDVDAHIKYAQFLTYYRDKIDEAEKIFKEAYKLAPRNVRTLSMYGDFLGRYRGNKDKAEKLFMEALEAAPDDSEVLELYAAFQYDIIGNSEKAEELFSKSIQSDPKNASAMARYTMLSAAEGNYHQGTFLGSQVYALTDRKDLILAIGFLQYIHLRESARVEAALAEIKRLVKAGVRAPWLNLQRNVDKAIKDGHENTDLLQVLSKVIANKMDLVELEKYEEWKSAE